MATCCADGKGLFNLATIEQHAGMRLRFSTLKPAVHKACATYRVCPALHSVSTATRQHGSPHMPPNEPHSRACEAQRLGSPASVVPRP